MTLVSEKISYEKGDVLFHPSHGLCLVRGVVEKNEMEGESFCYWLEPKRLNQGHTRFFVPVERIQEAGFHPPMTRKDAEEILRYLRKGDDLKDRAHEEQREEIRMLLKENTPWAHAKILLLLSKEKSNEHFQEECQALRHATSALTQELAFVLKISVKMAAARVRKNLEFFLQGNPWVRGVLERVS